MNESVPSGDVVPVDGVEESAPEGGISAFEMGRAAGETGGNPANPFDASLPEHHHFETGRKFGSRGNRSGSSSHWQRRKT